ncbi:unnamed protein product [Notodromas monacha]|uniref:Maspardin n=1 Tax=Notodromas monacha TaxID=399045 RepID=A0A7R9BGF0_9CRUS|nr:unnamed protein product [Notodromas monacha]CAG0914985.1 unnamed protein product [Notodromas monacha]
MARVSPGMPVEEPYSREYESFRSSVPLKRVVVDDNGSGSWEIYDCGPKEVRSPLIMFPPLSGSSDIYFKQLLALSLRNIRVLAVSWPAYWTVAEWCAGFRKLLDTLRLERVHLFGAALGGFLAQKFAEMHSIGRPVPRVASLILCNSFTDTSIFGYRDASPFFWLLPSMFLKRMVLGNMPVGSKDRDIVESVDFMVSRLEEMTQSQLASRLTLNCSPTYVMPQHLREIPITLIDVWDPCKYDHEELKEFDV